MFLAQVLSPEQSCGEVLKSFLACLALTEQKTASPNTGAYCRARKRLSLNAIVEVFERLARQGEKTEHSWYGRTVKVVDGSSVSMPDTPENQALYPQPSGQKPGCGFPVMRIVAVFSLGSGTLLHVAKSALATAERTLFHELWDVAFKCKDVLLADSGFCSYADLYFLGKQGVDCVMRNHKSRTRGRTELKRLGKSDRLVAWHKTKDRPAWICAEEWERIPNRMTVREIDVSIEIPGFRTRAVTLVSTLLDPRKFPKKAFADLYRRRWMAELFLRDIKTTMRMDILRCKTPDMIHKEFYMHLIAYNLIRAIMEEAACKKGRSAFTLSFKGACTTVRTWATALAAPKLANTQRRAMIDTMLDTIARDTLPNRPNRSEPRARKRRPKTFQLLTQHRKQFVETPHRNRYRKKLK